jgi:hypothetical protein
MLIEAESYLPESDNPLDAFGVANRTYATIGDNPSTISKNPRLLIQEAMNTYLKTGISFLATRVEDDQIKQVGETMWWSITKNLVETIHSKNLLRTLGKLDILTEELAEEIRDNHSSPVFHFSSEIDTEGRKIEDKGAYFILPYEFVICARQNPVEAIALLAKGGSLMRDFVNGVYINNPQSLMPRADIIQAHFLKYVTDADPSTSIPDYLRIVMKWYPEGIKSVPAGMMYKGVPGHSFLSADNN